MIMQIKNMLSLNDFAERKLDFPRFISILSFFFQVGSKFMQAPTVTKIQTRLLAKAFLEC